MPVACLIYGYAAVCERMVYLDIFFRYAYMVFNYAYFAYIGFRYAVLVVFGPVVVQPYRKREFERFLIFSRIRDVRFFSYLDIGI